MTSYWIFVVKDARVGKSTIRAHDIFGERMRRLYWLLNSRSPGVRRIRQEDMALFYIAGRDGRGFGGRCTVSATPQRLPPEVKRFIFEDPEDRFNFVTNLKEVDIFPSLAPMRTFLPRLTFIKDKDYWWRHLQGSAVSIPEEDYYMIVDTAMRPLKTERQPLKPG